MQLVVNFKLDVVNLLKARSWTSIGCHSRITNVLNNQMSKPSYLNILYLEDSKLKEIFDECGNRDYGTSLVNIIDPWFASNMKLGFPVQTKKHFKYFSFSFLMFVLSNNLFVWMVVAMLQSVILKFSKIIWKGKSSDKPFYRYWKCRNTDVIGVVP